MAQWNGARVNGIPVMGFGTWPLKGAEAVAAIGMALEAGFRHIDTAQMYGNEREVGEAVRASGLKREDVYIVSKVSPSVSRDHVEASIAASVEAIGCGPIDLMLMHWPTRDMGWFDAVITHLNEAQDAGLVKAIGISNCNIALMERAVKRSRHRIVANQVEFHALIDQSRLLAAARGLGIALEAYSPVARGAVMADPVVQRIAAARGVPAAEVGLAWILQQGVVALPMTTKRANAESNLRAMALRLSDEEMAALTEVSRGHQRFITAGDWQPDWD